MSTTRIPAYHAICLAFMLKIFLAGAELNAQSSDRILFDKDHHQVAIKPSSTQVTAEISKDDSAPGLVVTIQGGPEAYPGVELKTKEGKVWDLSQYGHVEAKVTNMGNKQLGIHLRIDNDADWKLNPFNTETLYLGPGKSGTVLVIFGHSYGNKLSYALKSSAISRMLVFTGKLGETQKFRIESITASGSAGEKPKLNPASVRTKPTGGHLLGGGVVIDPSEQILVKDGAEASLARAGKSLRLAFSKQGQSVTLKPPQGAWDLREGHQLRVKIMNTGSVAATPMVRVNSQPGSTDGASPKIPLGPGQSAEIIASFIPAVPWTGIKDAAKTEWNPIERTGTKFISDAVSGVTFSLSGGSEGQFEVESIVSAAPLGAIPEWLGKRPPVEGDWVQTFQEEFDGNAINLSKWNIYTANYWDKLSHFSKDNVIIANGVAKLRYEKKTGRHNDDPHGKETEYATGFIDTYGKWVQRYGYFEARMKIPNAPGLWPAMWLMPDRGRAEGEQWKRADTGRGGMEFDIMEYLSRWGRYRFNIAFHWDGYGKEHKQMGSQTIYVEHDKDGYITTGLLWLPGKATMYNNGKIIAQWESPRISNVPSDIMFTHVMGGWDNNQLDDSKLPDDFIIDYVRCWQRKDLASEKDGVKSTQSTPQAPTTPDS